MDGTKQAIRHEMRRRRRALSAVDLDTADRAAAEYVGSLPAFQAARGIIAYAATDHEVPTARLIEAAFGAGKRVYLPRLEGEVMSFAEYRRGVDLRPGAHGIPEPLGEQIEARDLVEAVAFVPLLAWDDTGLRVGRGGGHYDRAFAGPTRPGCLVGLGYTFQQCAAVPFDRWDLQLDWVVTERGAVCCWRGGESTAASRKEGAIRDGIPDDGVGRRRAGRRAGLVGGSSPAPTS
jgi:5-formyltetrahydrofolate cyclo-ligase